MAFGDIAMALGSGLNSLGDTLQELDRNAVKMRQQEVQEKRTAETHALNMDISRQQKVQEAMQTELMQAEQAQKVAAAKQKDEEFKAASAPRSPHDFFSNARGVLGSEQVEQLYPVLATEGVIKADPSTGLPAISKMAFGSWMKREPEKAAQFYTSLYHAAEGTQKQLEDQIKAAQLKNPEDKTLPGLQKQLDNTLAYKDSIWSQTAKITQERDKKMAELNAKIRLEEEKAAARAAFKENKPSEDIQEYEYAKKEGYKGSFADYVANVKRRPNNSTGGGAAQGQGKPPSGFKWTAEGNLEPIPGGPADFKMTDARNKKEGRLNAVDSAIKEIEGLIQHPGRKLATGASGVLPGIPSTSQQGFISRLDTFQNKMFIPVVEQMKGMGQLSDAEGKRLVESVGALKRTMSEGEFKESMQEVLSELKQKREIAARGVVSTDNPKARPSGGGLSPAEQAELDALRKRFGK